MLLWWCISRCPHPQSSPAQRSSSRGPSYCALPWSSLPRLAMSCLVFIFLSSFFLSFFSLSLSLFLIFKGWRITSDGQLHAFFRLSTVLRFYRFLVGHCMSSCSPGRSNHHQSFAPQSPRIILLQCAHPALPPSSDTELLITNIL